MGESLWVLTLPRFLKHRRLVLSDGEHYQQAMLATQLNDTIDMDNFKPNTLVRLDEVICNVVQDRR